MTVLYKFTLLSCLALWLLCGSLKGEVSLNPLTDEFDASEGTNPDSLIWDYDVSPNASVTMLHDGQGGLAIDVSAQPGNSNRGVLRSKRTDLNFFQTPFNISWSISSIQGQVVGGNANRAYCMIVDDALLDNQGVQPIKAAFPGNCFTSFGLVVDKLADSTCVLRAVQTVNRQVGDNVLVLSNRTLVGQALPSVILISFGHTDDDTDPQTPEVATMTVTIPGHQFTDGKSMFSVISRELNTTFNPMKLTEQAYANGHFRLAAGAINNGDTSQGTVAVFDQIKVAQSPSLHGRLRGASIQAYGFSSDLIDQMADDNINCVRLWINGRNGVSAPTAENPLAPYQLDIDYILENGGLAACAAKGIQVILTVGNLYGQRNTDFWKSNEAGRTLREHLPAFWNAVAKLFNEYPQVVALDLLNEPQYPAGYDDVWYDDLLPKTIASVRGINPGIWLVIEPGPWSFPGDFSRLEPVEDPAVMYSIHPYHPHDYTHQYLGIRSLTELPSPNTKAYPGYLQLYGTSPLVWWDYDTMEASMQPVIDFQQSNPYSRILVGEFGVIRWAPGAADWLYDSISVFENFGWDWCVIGYPTQWVPNATNIWSGWNLTYTDDDPRIDGPYIIDQMTDRLDVVLEGWSLN